MTFPIDFQIKIMGKNTPSFLTDITNIAYSHYPHDEVLMIRSHPSGQGNYLAISLTVHAKDQKTLDALYLDFTKHPDVKMVL